MFAQNRLETVFPRTNKKYAEKCVVQVTFGWKMDYICFILTHRTKNLKKQDVFLHKNLFASKV